jgi:hypothetical protein
MMSMGCLCYGVLLFVVWYAWGMFACYFKNITVFHFISALQRITHRGQNIETYWNIHLWKNMVLQMLMWQSGMLEPSSCVKLTHHAVHRFKGNINRGLLLQVFKVGKHLNFFYCDWLFNSLCWMSERVGVVNITAQCQQF